MGDYLPLWPPSVAERLAQQRRGLLKLGTPENSNAPAVCCSKLLSRLTISDGPFDELDLLELDANFAVWVQEQPILEAFA